MIHFTRNSNSSQLILQRRDNSRVSAVADARAGKGSLYSVHTFGVILLLFSLHKRANTKNSVLNQSPVEQKCLWLATLSRGRRVVRAISEGILLLKTATTSEAPIDRPDSDMAGEPEGMMVSKCQINIQYEIIFITCLKMMRLLLSMIVQSWLCGLCSHCLCCGYLCCCCQTTDKEKHPLLVRGNMWEVLIAILLLIPLELNDPINMYVYIESMLVTLAMPTSMYMHTYQLGINGKPLPQDQEVQEMECRYSEPSTPGGGGTPWGSERHSEASEAPDLGRFGAVYRKIILFKQTIHTPPPT